VLKGGSIVPRRAALPEANEGTSQDKPVQFSCSVSLKCDKMKLRDVASAHELRSK
jgi:hypothetical protein